MSNIIKRVWHKNKMVSIESLHGMAFQSEDGGHTFEISGVDDSGATVAFSGTISGVFMRPDRADVALTGAVSDGVASVTLSDACYAVPGRFGLTVFVTEGGKTTAIYAAVGTVARTSGGVVAGETAQDVVDLINAINAAVATIPPSYAELASDVSDLKDETHVEYEELPYTFQSGKMIRHATGVESDSSQSSATGFVAIDKYKTLKYKRVKATQTTAPAAGMAFYDSSKTYISGLVSAYNQAEAGYMDYEITVPENAAYARFTFYQDSSLGTFSVYGAQGIRTYAESLGASIKELYSETFPNTLFNLFLLGTESGALNSQTGIVVDSTDYKTTIFIDVTGFSKLYLNRGSRYWFYDSTKTKLSTGNLNDVSATYGSLKELSVPADAAYFRISVNNESVGDAYIYGDAFISDAMKSAIKAEKDPLKYYAIGDSITRGMYAEYGTSSSTGPIAQGYPYWIGVENGYTVVNLGESGGGYASKGTQSNSNCKDIVDANAFTGADIITIAFGVNDWKNATQDVILGSMASAAGDGTVIGNMKYSIEKLYEKAPKAQLIVMLPFNTNRVFSGMDANAMTLENNWAFGYAYRHNQTLEDYRAAIRTCAEYYNVRVIDLEEVLPINRLNIRYVCGDGLHPTKAFYKQMGHALAPLIV